MKKIKIILVWIVSIVLAICGFAIFNESDSFIPNIVGLACWAAFAYIHRDNKYIG